MYGTQLVAVDKWNTLSKFAGNVIHAGTGCYSAPDYPFGFMAGRVIAQVAETKLRILTSCSFCVINVIILTEN